MSAEDEIAVLMTAAKKRKESMELFEKGGRPELVGKRGESWLAYRVPPQANVTRRCRKND